MSACADADTDSNEFEGPIATKSRASSPAHSMDDSAGFTEGELEAFVDTLEVTTIPAGDTRTLISKPKPSMTTRVRLAPLLTALGHVSCASYPVCVNVLIKT